MKDCEPTFILKQRLQQLRTDLLKTAGNCHKYMLDYIVMKMRKVNRELGYYC